MTVGSSANLGTLESGWVEVQREQRGGAGQGKAVPRLEARRWETANEPSIADDIVEVSCTDNQSQPNNKNF